MDNQLVQIIRDVGFPIFVALFVLIRLNGRLERLNSALSALVERLDILTDLIRNNGGKLR